MAGNFKTNLLFGVAAGVAGTVMMGAYFRALKKLAPGESGKQGSEEELTTEKVARAALRQVGVRNPPRQLVARGGDLVHWGYGITWGAITGLARSAGIRLDWDGGLWLGLGLWAGGDTWMLYEMGFARHPREYPAQVHAKAVGAHLAYGLGVWAAMEGLTALERRREFRPRKVELRRVA